MYTSDGKLYIAHSSRGPINIIGKMANRHGLIAGATGTGKTVTLQVMAETFCQAGVPCFMADMKGDLSGISRPGRMTGFIEKRKDEFGVPDPVFQPCPVRFFDVYGEQGTPIRAAVSSLGPQLLARLMGLNDTQTGILNIIFRVADDRGLLLYDLKDFRALLNYVSANAKSLNATYGNIAPQSVGAISRSLLELENQGANQFFGMPELDIMDLMQTQDGKGVMNVLAADRLMLQPKLYSTFLLWLISDLYARLPEVGDLDKPKLVFFFDEAHTLFDDTPKALTDKIEQVIRLIRSKGVGIYFVTQSPTDIPQNILGQLGNRVQHALRAFTPKDQKAVRAAAETFRANPEFKTDEAIMNLETGEALVSVLDDKGAPTVVQRAKILFPLSQIGAISPEERKAIIDASPLHAKYAKPVDPESAFEVLLRESEQPDGGDDSSSTSKARKSSAKPSSALGRIWKTVGTAVVSCLATMLGSWVSGKISGAETRGKSAGDIAGQVAKRATSAATRSMVKEITRSVLGTRD